MAFGKADVGLIQADRAAQKIDPNLGYGMAVDKMLGGMKQAAAAQADATRKFVANANNAFDKSIASHYTGDDSLKPSIESWMTESTTTLKGDHAKAGDQVGRSKAINSAKKDITFGLELNDALVQTIENRGVFSPGMSEDDKYFARMFGGEEFKIVNQNGVHGITIKNKDGKGETFFDKNNLPVGFSQFNEGSTAILGVWDTNHGTAIDYSKKQNNTAVEKDYKNKLMVSNNGGPPTLQQAMDIITQDHSNDGVENPFMGSFKSGALDPSFYTFENGDYIQVNGKTYNPDAILRQGVKDPRGGLTEQDLEDFLRNKNSKGKVEGENRNNHVGFIVDKYSKFMGDVTNTEYEKQQKDLMIKNQTYFNEPNSDGSFSTFFTTKGVEPKVGDVTTRKNEVNNSMRFDAATTAYIGTGADNRGAGGAELERVTNWTEFDFGNQLDKDGSLLKNIQTQYKGSDVESISAKDGVLTFKMPGDDGGLTEFTFDFTTGDQNETMERLKTKLNFAKFSTGFGADELGNDASTWYEQLNKNNNRIETNPN
jgi:hypothetical protein